MTHPSPRPLSSDTRIHLGVSWYPEMWPEDEWPRDIAKMKEAGFTLVRLFEFSWKRFEPREGDYDFEWARRVLDLLQDAGIQAMLGTPTAAPPAWLTTAYPEVLMTRANGVQKTHGQRKHTNPHSARYRELARGIVRKMAEMLGDHPAVHSWQIDNEMSGFDYGGETRLAFHRWLQARYGTIEALNAAWGLQFWSQAYDTFSQIPLCTANVGTTEVPERHHPSLIMAIARFQNEGWTAFMQDQCDVIRRQCPHPITSNMTGFIGQMDWDRHFQVMDRAGVSSYADIDHTPNNAIKLDRLRAAKEAPYWLLETAPNWSGGGQIWNIHRNEDGVRMFTWMSILLGGSMVLYWQWRSHWAGQEMQHGTCVDATGAWMPGKEVWQRLSTEFRTHEDWLLQHPAARGPLAIMAGSESAWGFSIDPIHPSNSSLGKRLLADYYQPLRDHQYHPDIIHPDTPLTPYRLILCPHLPLLPDHTRERLTTWVREGGSLLLGPLTGYRTEEFTANRDSRFGELEHLMGASSTCHFPPHDVEDTIQIVFSNGTICHPRIWCEAFTPDEGSEVLAHYSGGYGDGEAAVVSRSLGEGYVITIGCPLDSACLLSLVQSVAEKKGLYPSITAPAGVFAAPRVDGDGRVCGVGIINSTVSPHEVSLPRDGVDLLSGREVTPDLIIEPYGIRIITYPGTETRDPTSPASRL